MPHMHGTVNEVTRGSKAHQRRLMMTLTLTGTVFVAEIVGAIITGSLALLVDAGHMLTDMSVLIASTVTAVLMRRKPNSSRTWGWARLEVLTAEAGAMILLFVGLYALIEAGIKAHEAETDALTKSENTEVRKVCGAVKTDGTSGEVLCGDGKYRTVLPYRRTLLQIYNRAGDIADLADLIAKPTRIQKEIIRQLEAVKKAHGQDRRTEILLQDQLAEEVPEDAADIPIHAAAAAAPALM